MKRLGLTFMFLAACGSAASPDAATPNADAGSADTGTADVGHDAAIDAACTDQDGDGACALDDCDDHDPTRRPGAAELCDTANVDEDCDPTTVGQLDVDHDGHVSSACCNPTGSGMTCGDDCDDTRTGVHPGEVDACNALDDDCDGAVDEAAGVELYADLDRDAHGDPGNLVTACPGMLGTSAIADDCDDTSASVYPGRPETCDGIDNDCDTVIDDATTTVPWYVDADGDGAGDPTSATIDSCAPVAGRSALANDCDDDAATRHPGSAEQCNAVDDDCNGEADYAIGVNDREDDDADGIADTACGGTDCNDRDPDARPGVGERCNGRDDDCDGRLDEACSGT